VVGPLSRTWPATAVLAAMVAGLVGSPLRQLGLTPTEPPPSVEVSRTPV